MADPAPLRIAFFVSDYPVLSETFVIRQIAGVVARGHAVTIVTGYHHRDRPDPFDGAVAVREVRQGPTIPRLAKSGLRLLASGPFTRRGRQRLSGLAAALLQRRFNALPDILLAGKGLGRFDAIIAHFGPAGVRAMTLQAAGLLDGPLATIFHGTDMSRYRLVRHQLPHYRRLFRSSALLLPISARWASQLIAWGAPPARVQVLPMGVDLDRLPAAPVTRPLHRPLRLLSVARLVEKKGLGDAIAGVTRASAPLSYDIIGEGPLAATLATAAAESPHPIRLRGRRPHAEVFAALKETDVFLLPSVTAADGDAEGIPVSLMEAMAMGVLVLATRHSGIPELIEDGVSGFLVDEHDPAAIAAVLDRIAQGEVDIAAMRTAARAAVADRFDNARLDDQLEGICRALAAHAAGARSDSLVCSRK